MSNFFEYMYSVNSKHTLDEKVCADESAEKSVKDAIVEELEEETKVKDKKQ